MLQGVPIIEKIIGIKYPLSLFKNIATEMYIGPI